MSTLVDVSEYVAHILRLDLETPVRGFDGTDLGPSNEQAQALANRTLWLKNRCESLQLTLQELGDRNYVASINKKTGNVTITYDDIGAAAKSHKHLPSDIETSAEASFVSLAEKQGWDSKQEQLVSGSTLKTVLGMSLLGKGDIKIQGKDITTSPDFLLTSESEKGVWNNKQDALVSGTNIVTVHGKSLLGSEDIKLTFADVNADKKGTAAKAIADHEAEEDPHAQYLNEERGKNLFLSKTEGNKPNGFLQLDKNGYIPSELAKLYEARYIVVNNEAERLAITQNKNLTISMQLDENKIYYLNSDLDPSVNSNWVAGRTTEVSEVISVFGRSGIVVPEAGDYNADQITETTDRKFVSPTDKQNWDGKQSKLVSGDSIRTINGETLLGASDIAITPESIGAAEKTHTHLPSEISTDDNNQFVTAKEKLDWGGKQPKLVSGENIKTINGNDVTGAGNISITPESIGAAEEVHEHAASEIKEDVNHLFVTTEEKAKWSGKQDSLVSGTSIKTLNGEALLGEGDISITPESISAAEKIHKHKASDIETDTQKQFVSQEDKTLWSGKQAKLVSGKNVSTVFGKSLLSGNDVSLSDVENLHYIIASLMKGSDGVEITVDNTNKKINITGPNDPEFMSSMTVIDVPGATAKDYIYPQGVKLGYNFRAYALKETIVSNAEQITTNYTDTMVNGYPKTTLPDFDRNNLALASPKVSLPVTLGTNGSIYHSTTSIDVTGLDSLTIESDIDISGLVPVFSSAASKEEITPVSSTPYPGYEPWKAFQAPFATVTNVAAETYWSDREYFNSKKGDVWLGIISERSLRINGYQFQVTGTFNLGTSTHIKSWELQGRNSDVEEWTVLDTRTGEDITSGTYYKQYYLPNEVTYKEYRIVVTDVVNPGARTSIPRLQFLYEPPSLIKGNDNKLYTITSDKKLAEVVLSDPSELKYQGFVGPQDTIPVSELMAVNPFTVVSSEDGAVVLSKYAASNQLVLHRNVKNTSSWLALMSIQGTIFAATTDVSRMRVGITLNGYDWYSFKNNAWHLVGTLDTTTDSSKRMYDSGMTFDELKAITKDQWSALTVTSSDAIQFGICYASKMSKKDDALVPKTTVINIDKLSNWNKSSGSDVVISIRTNAIAFRPNRSGNYKFCYEFIKK